MLLLAPATTQANPSFASFAARAGDAQAVAASATSIAVLPFANRSNRRDKAFLVAGIQNLIRNKLADIGSLKVIANTSTRDYASHPTDLPQVAQDLHVATILEGSVRASKSGVMLEVRLIGATTGRSLCTRTIVGKTDQAFALAAEAAEQIVAALNVRLTTSEKAKLAAIPTHDFRAFELFLRAEYQANRADIVFAAAGWKSAISLYRKAVARDPGFALAFARLSYVEGHLAWFGGAGEDVRRLAEQADADAHIAIKLAPHLAAAGTAIGYSYYWGKNDYVDALKAFNAAIASGPNESNALAARGYVARRMGRFEAAIASLRQALACDPRNSGLVYDVGTTYMMVGRYVDAETWLRRAIRLDPNNDSAKTFNSNAILFRSGDVQRALTAAGGDAPTLKLQQVALLTLQRRYREAIAILERLPDTPDNFQAISGGSKAQKLADLQRLAHHAATARPLFERALTQLRAESSKVHGIAAALAWHNIADIELGLGRTSVAMADVEKSQRIAARTRDKVYGPGLMEANAATYAAANRPKLAVPLLARALATPGIGSAYAPVMLWLDPSWDPIRHDPEFRALLQQYAKYKPAATYDTPPAS